MSIEESNSIDGLGVSSDKKSLKLLVADYLDWENEYEHLILLQKKINSYINFIETEQYKSIYPKYDFERFTIELQFKYNITDNCRKFIETATQQIKELNTVINYIVFE